MLTTVDIVVLLAAALIISLPFYCVVVFVAIKFPKYELYAKRLAGMVFVGSYFSKLMFRNEKNDTQNIPNDFVSFKRDDNAFEPLEQKASYHFQKSKYAVQKCPIYMTLDQIEQEIIRLESYLEEDNIEFDKQEWNSNNDDDIVLPDEVRIKLPDKDIRYQYYCYLYDVYQCQKKLVLIDNMITETAKSLEKYICKNKRQIRQIFGETIDGTGLHKRITKKVTDEFGPLKNKIAYNLATSTFTPFGELMFELIPTVLLNVYQS